MNDKALDEELSHIVKGVLTWEVDSTRNVFEAPEEQPQPGEHVQIEERKRAPLIDRSEFWETIYVEHSKESTFYYFLRGGDRILCVSGHVGTGKSTFIRHKFEKVESECCGVIIDMRAYRNRFKEQEDYAPILKKVVAECFKKALLLSLRSVVADPGKLEIFNRTLNLEKAQVDTRIEVGGGTVDFDWNSLELREQARKQLAVEALYLLDTQKVVQERQRIGAGGGNDLEKRKSFHRAMEASEVRDRVIDLLEWREYVTLYRCFYRNGALQPVIVLDNMDALTFSHKDDDFLNTLATFQDEVNIDVGIRAPAIKMIYAVRDENICRMGRNDGSANRFCQIRMTDDDYRISARRHEVIGIDSKFAHDVVSHRLSKIQKSLEEKEAAAGGNVALEQFSYIRQCYEAFWVQAGEKSTREKIADLHILEFNNSSLRLYLDMLQASLLSSVEHYLSQKIRDADFLSTYGNQSVKGRLVQSLWSLESTRGLMKVLTEDATLEKKELHCSQYRLVLTHLHKVARDGTKEVQEIVKTLEEVFEADRKEILTVLFELYWSQAKHGELITIYQFGPIDKPEHIKLNAKIRLNTKGDEFLRKVMTSVDYFGGILDRHGAILAEMLPSEASEYLGAIFYDLVQPMTLTHMKLWGGEICQQLGCDDHEIPFEAYRDFLYGKETGKGKEKAPDFYMTRVTSTHRSAITGYLAEVFRGPESNLLISGEKREQLLEEIPESLLEPRSQRSEFDPRTTGARRPNTKQITKFLKGISEASPIQEIWQIYKAYDELAKKQKSLKTMTLADLNEKYNPSPTEEQPSTK